MPVIDLLLSILVIVAMLSFSIGFVLSYFVIASRKDWVWETRAFLMIGITVGFILAAIILPIYATIDMITRPRPTHRTKAGFIAAVLLLPGFGILAYFVWALQTGNRTEPRVAPPRRPIPVTFQEPATPPDLITITDDGSKALTAKDLEYLQRLADLRSQGIITDQQYETQRRQRIGE